MTTEEETKPQGFQFEPSFDYKKTATQAQQPDRWGDIARMMRKKKQQQPAMQQQPLPAEQGIDELAAFLQKYGVEKSGRFS